MPAGPPSRPTRRDASRSWTLGLPLGTACAFGLTVFSLSLAVAIGLCLIVAALVRRRVDIYGMFAIGFVLGIAVYLAIAVWAGIMTSSPDSGSRSSPGT